MDLLTESDIYNYIISEAADPVINQSSSSGNDVFMNWEDLNTPTIDADPFVDRLLETLEKQESLDAVHDDHSYASSNKTGSMSPSSSTGSGDHRSTHSPQSGVFDGVSNGARTTSESGASYQYEVMEDDSSENDILEQATQALYSDDSIIYTLDEEPILPPVRRQPPIAKRVMTNRPITVTIAPPATNYAKRNAQRQRGRPPNSSYTEKTVYDAKLSGKYPALSLTPEERKYMEKEGIRLPSHYPLTKQEESLLKRIRRKIRNKKSAQTSRTKQKEYIDALEYRTEKLEEEKDQLCDQVNQLAEQNKSLMEQIRALQRTVSNGTRRSAQASTCLAVILLSFMLVLSPSMHPLMQSDVADTNNNNQQQVGGAAPATVAKPAIMPGRSRSLQSIELQAPDLQQQPWQAYMEHLHPVAGNKRRFNEVDVHDLLIDEQAPPVKKTATVKLDLDDLFEPVADAKQYPSVYLANRTAKNAYDE